MYLKSRQIKQNLNYTYPIDLVLDGIPFGATIQSVMRKEISVAVTNVSNQ